MYGWWLLPQNLTRQWRAMACWRSNPLGMWVFRTLYQYLPWPHIWQDGLHPSGLYILQCASTELMAKSSILTLSHQSKVVFYSNTQSTIIFSGTDKVLKLEIIIRFNLMRSISFRTFGVSVKPITFETRDDLHFLRSRHGKGYLK